MELKEYYKQRLQEKLFNDANPIGRATGLGARIAGLVDRTKKS